MHSRSTTPARRRLTNPAATTGGARHSPAPRNGPAAKRPPSARLRHGSTATSPMATASPVDRNRHFPLPGAGETSLPARCPSVSAVRRSMSFNRSRRASHSDRANVARPNSMSKTPQAAMTARAFGGCKCSARYSPLRPSWLSEVGGFGSAIGSIVYGVTRRPSAPARPRRRTGGLRCGRCGGRCC